MPTYELNPEDYNLEKVEVKLAQLAETTFQLLDHNLKTATDNDEVAHLFDSYLNSFFAEYDRIHKKGEELDPNNIVITDISYNKEDLIKFQRSTLNIVLLINETKESLPDYRKYLKALNAILSETERNIKRLGVKKNPESEQLAA